MLSSRHLVVVVLACLYLEAVCVRVLFPRNATIACNHMTPLHSKSPTPQASIAPFKISRKLENDGTYSVTVKGTDSGTFQGFFLQARDQMTNKRVGLFTQINDIARPITCDYEGDAIHQNYIDDYSVVKVRWNPNGFEGTIQFRLTVVKTYEIYWTNIISQPLLVGAGIAEGNTDKKILKMLKKMEKNQINAGCPTGFFRCIPSNQCFKYFTDVRRNFTEAIEKCSNNSLTLAQPMYPVSVRSYIVANYGKYSYNWLGARGNNKTVDWLRGGMEISNQTKAYYYGAIRVSSNYAMLMLTSSYYETRFPNKPYYSAFIRYNAYTLCELTVE